MLGKLIKHEFKAQIKIYGAMYLFTFLLSVVNFVLHLLGKRFPNVPVISGANAFALFLFVIMLAAIFIGTLIFSVLRFRSNLLKDEGYLMHTLPVKASAHVITKLLVPFVWYALDVVVALITIGISAGEFSMYGKIVDYLDFSELSGMGAYGIVVMIVLVIISTFSGLLQFYFSMAIGYTAYSSKDLMSFVAYILTYFVNQIISVVALVIVFLAKYRTLFVDETLIQADNLGAGFANTILTSTLVVSVIVTVAYYLLTVHFLENKLNLE